MLVLLPPQPTSQVLARFQESNGPRFVGAILHRIDQGAQGHAGEEPTPRPQYLHREPATKVGLVAPASTAEEASLVAEHPLQAEVLVVRPQAAAQFLGGLSEPTGRSLGRRLSFRANGL